MNELDAFVKSINDICQNIGGTELDIEKARVVIKELNEFLYTNYDGIGNTEALGEQFEYISDFHKYWNEHYREILNIQIVENQCQKIAIALHDIYKMTDGKAFSELYDTYGLTKNDICRIRFLTANQDFRGSISFRELVDIFRSDNSIFDEKKIFDNPEEFVKLIGVTGLSQNDKRIIYAKNISKFLIELNCDPFSIIDKYNRDVLAFRTSLTSYNGAGYGNKKADMFIRDMVVLSIWDNITGFDKINVASDVNTIKVALRTGIIKTDIPLVSSFLDIFCYQYGYVDSMNANAWRKVWEIWKKLFPSESIESPCLMDYFVYNVVGKQFCKEILYFFQCNSEKHMFKWHSSHNKTCQICYKADRRNEKATLIRKVMPCMDADGDIAISQTTFVLSQIISPTLNQCPFQAICNDNNTNILQPPKSISIKGQTGWTSSYTKKEQGGGGLMA